MTGWLLTILTIIGALLLAVVKADLQDAAVFRWLTRKLIYRAADHLPRGERARWREEAIRDALDLPGRLPPLLWALDTYVKAGRWGRARGAPSRSQALMAWLRATWQRLRALPAARAKPPTQQVRPASIQAPAEVAQGTTAVALNADLGDVANVAAVGTTQTISSVDLEPQLLWWIPAGPWRAELGHLTDEQFLEWLAQQRRAHDEDIDRQVEKYWQGRGRWPRS